MGQAIGEHQAVDAEVPAVEGHELGRPRGSPVAERSEPVILYIAKVSTVGEEHCLVPRLMLLRTAKGLDQALRGWFPQSSSAMMEDGLLT